MDRQLDAESSSDEEPLSLLYLRRRDEKRRKKQVMDRQLDSESSSDEGQGPGPDAPPKVKLLGFGLPLNDIPLTTHAGGEWIRFRNAREGGKRLRFPRVLMDWVPVPITVMERKMMALIREFMEDPGWKRKAFDDAIVETWRSKAIAQSQISDQMFDYCIRELQDKAAYLERRGFVAAIDADAAVYISDSLVEEKSRQALQHAAGILEDAPEAEKDWCPESDGRVLNLVDPSLYPLVYGRSRILPTGTVPLDGCIESSGKGETVPGPEGLVNRSPFLDYIDLNMRMLSYSSMYQRLPSEVTFGANDRVEFASYINNLHPTDHKALYAAIEDVIPKAVKMWNATLTALERQERPTRIDTDRIPDCYVFNASPPTFEDEDPEERLKKERDWKKANRIPVRPEPSDYSIRSEYEAKQDALGGVQLEKEFANRGLQIIVKLANIHLTPEKPTYAGGSWRIEGPLNEHICALALYCYSSENITDSRLAFRETMIVDHFEDCIIDDGLQYFDFEHLHRFYGVEPSGSPIQELGSVLAKEGRLLTFPNVLQYREEPFQLADTTRPGHMKILALFLVDPYTRIPSTANVPPQQEGWRKGMVMKLDRVADLPVELAEQVADKLVEDSPFDFGEAKRRRLDFVAQRKEFEEVFDSGFNKITNRFNFDEPGSLFNLRDVIDSRADQGSWT